MPYLFFFYESFNLFEVISVGSYCDQGRQLASQYEYLPDQLLYQVIGS